MTELKSCPFCGGEAELHIEKQGLRWEANIICKRVFYGLNRCPANMGLFQLGDDKEETIKTITSRWNTRATPWHTGTPTEGGLYFVYDKYCGYGKRVLKKDISKEQLEVAFHDVLAWIPIEPYKED